MNIVCSICTEIFTGQEDNETISSTICGHVFHHHCIIPWIQEAKTCPICRKVQTINKIMKLNLHIDAGNVYMAKLQENEELRLENQRLKDEIRDKAVALSFSENNARREDCPITEDLDRSQIEMREAILSSAVDRVAELEKKVLELEQENDRLRQMYFTE